ncbi:putative quinol monooxygenase [Martelella alba]|uniref:Antibiotic biosynthesis monooxygenase n=1 Tax=Martelella alba TaxID=2590451 RepID=A0ABY2SKU0_9HYPH|nr:putative quinol monooxygenase [Martelella alba]TKI04872.1 antibiotic biosynthesis monooxygenase [Martelella alba]
MITVIAEIKVKPGRRDAVLAAIQSIRPDVLAEDGCGEYTLLVDYRAQVPWRKTAPDSIFMLEQWKSIRHLEQHQQAPHMDAHRARIKNDVMDVTFHILEKRND